MVSVSANFRATIFDDHNFLLWAEIELADGTTLTVDRSQIWQGGFTIEDATSSETDFQVGAAIINKFTLVLNNMYGDFTDYDFRLAKITAKVALEARPSEIITKGVYIVNETSYQDPLITLECYDNMWRFEKPYALSNTTYPATLATIIREACSECDVTLGTATFPYSTTVIASRPGDQVTYREVVSWCAQIAGCFARCNRNGALELKWYDVNAFAYGNNPAKINQITAIFKPDLCLDKISITGVRITVKTESGSSDALRIFTTGEEGYVIALADNPFITEDNAATIIDWLGTQLIGLEFWKVRLSHLATPVIEAGDALTFWDRSGKQYDTLVTKTVFRPGERQITSCSAQDPARNSVTRYSEATKTYIQLRELIHDEKTDREQAYDELSRRINSTTGLYTTVETGVSGTIYYMHNKPLLAESDVIWKMTSEAWAVSTDGGTTWNAGVTVDGTVIAQIMSTIGLDFDWGVGGQLVIRDTTGNETFFADAETGVVRINATAFSLSGTALNSIVQGAVDDLTIGGRNLFLHTLNPTATSLPALIDQDASTYSVGTKSAAEHGIRITATANSSRPMVRFGSTTTSPFDVTCQCMEPGETYTWSADASWKVMSSATGLANTSTYYVRIYCYYLKNERTAYTVMYKNVQKMDAAYRGVDMSARVEYTFTLPSDAIGAYLAFFCNAPAVNYLKDDYVELANIKLEKGTKATAWTPAPEDLKDAAESYTDSAAAAAEAYADTAAAAAVNAQTQQDIFNRLTSNGTIQGIYMEGGQLYISFSYAKGGTLKLGGANNGNGLMQIYDASDNLIGSWGKDGLVANTGGRIQSANGRVYFDLTNNELACSTLRSSTVPGAVETMIKTGESSQWFDNNGVGLGDLTYINICRSGYESNGLMISPTTSGQTLIRSYRGMQLLTSYGTEPFVNLNLGLSEFALYNVYDSSIRSAYKTVYFGDSSSSGEVTTDYTTNLYVYGTIGATGTKSRIVKTEDYGTRRLYCYEVPTPMFGDVGEGVIGEDGKCYVSIDPVFAETIADGQYQVFLQAYGQGDAYVSDRESVWFIVSGTPGLAFGWEIKAKQKEYDQIRLEEDGIVDPHLSQADYAASATAHIAEITAERTEK